jgi:hypothetical protein
MSWRIGFWRSGNGSKRVSVAASSQPFSNRPATFHAKRICTRLPSEACSSWSCGRDSCRWMESEDRRRSATRPGRGRSYLSSIQRLRRSRLMKPTSNLGTHEKTQSDAIQKRCLQKVVGKFRADCRFDLRPYCSRMSSASVCYKMIAHSRTTSIGKRKGSVYDPYRRSGLASGKEGSSASFVGTFLGCRPQLRLDRGVAPLASALASPLKSRGEGPMRGRRRRGKKTPLICEQNSTSKQPVFST